MWWVAGGDASTESGSRGSRIVRALADRAVFPPEEVTAVKAVACELPHSEGVPLSRFSRTELHRLVIERALTEASASTIWRWLHDDALRPWQQRSWVFPRDPDFHQKAARVLDLYEGRWEGKLLHPGEFVISADEKTQLQALQRKHPTLPPGPGRPMLVEHEFERCEERVGIEPFGRLVGQVMSEEPYASAPRVFWIVDNGSSHAGRASIERLEGTWENLRLIHLPYHASWLNQIEIYFSILQRKALTPKNFDSLDALAERIIGFQDHWQQVAEPFDWNFTRRHLDQLIARLAEREPQLGLAA